MPHLPASRSERRSLQTLRIYLTKNRQATPAENWISLNIDRFMKIFCIYLHPKFSIARLINLVWILASSKILKTHEHYHNQYTHQSNRSHLRDHP